MLRGKILSIQFTGKWIVVLDGHRKEFDYWADVGSYLRTVIEKGQDQGKVKLLKEDVIKLYEGR